MAQAIKILTPTEPFFNSLLSCRFAGSFRLSPATDLSPITLAITIAMKNAVKHGQYEERQEGRTNDSSNDHGSQRTLNLSSSPGGDRHRNKPERCDQRRHQDRPEPGQGAGSNRFMEKSPFGPPPAKKRDN